MFYWWMKLSKSSAWLISYHENEVYFIKRLFQYEFNIAAFFPINTFP